MKLSRIPFLSCLIFLCTSCMLSFGQIREITDLNSSWKFFLNPAVPANSPDFNDNGWMIVDLPHTWNAEDGYNNNYVKGAGWYRKKVFIPTTFAGKRIYLKFEHANLIAQVFVNGIDKGSHEGGYAAFIFDITSSLTFGANNTIAVKVDNTVNGKIAPLSGDFTFFGGITGKVQLIVTNNINICPIDYASSGIYITQKSVTASAASIAVKVLLDNYTGQAKSVAAELNVNRPDQISVTTIQKTVLLPANSVKIPVLFEFTIPGPILWDARNNPYLYSVKATIKESNNILDQVTQPMGIRYFEIRKDSGFFLNGKSYPLYGVNMHEDRPGKGRAISDNDRSEDLTIMKDLGVSFLRLSHYQHGSFTYDYADKNGIILWTEIPLIDHINTTYPEYFKSNIKEQLKELIRQNFNHPSVCFWGLFNEILNQPGPSPVPLITELNNLAHAEDPGRPTVAANNQPDYPVNVSNITDLISHNRYFGWYYGKANDLQTWIDQVKPGANGIPVGLSEYGGGSSILHHELYPKMPGVLIPSWHPEELQNEIHEDYWNIIKNNPFLWQTTAWVAFDFISNKKKEGDKLGINDKGLISHDRKTKKDAYYFYKSQWTKEPLVYITSRRFLQRQTGTTYIKVYSNCDSVELLVNNKTLGYRKPVESIFTWENFVLSEGVNFLIARSVSGDQYAADSCFWIYGGLSHEPGMKINFETSGTDTPNGYIADTGLKFPYTANNLTFGWNADNAGNSRDRNLLENKIYDTFNHLQKNGLNYVWEIKLSNGLYYVEVVAGDPLFHDSHHKILVENRLLLDGVPDPSNIWIYAGDTVKVTDGRLTISSAPDAVNSKINFLQITRVDSINLSFNKTVKQSSTLYSSIAERAIDNNTDGLWINGSVTHTGSDANAWWEIDLGKISEISTIEIWDRIDICCSNRLSDFYIIVSNDPFDSQGLNATLSQQNIWSYHQMASPEPNKVFPVNRSGRYIRIQLNKTDNLYLAEVIVNGFALLPPESPTNLTSNVTDDHSIQLFWNDNSSDESGFIVERKSDSWYYSVIDTLDPNTLEFEDTDVNDGEGYSYRLKAFNQSGESDYSNVISDSLGTYDLINLATGKTATQSSTLFNSYAGLAIDENTNGVWINRSVTHTGEETNPWWQIDLGTISNINSITVWNRTDCCKARLKDFYILVSENPFEVNDLNQLINNPGIWVEFHPGYPDPSINVAINKKGRYVRIQLAGNGPLSLAEVIINGTPEGEPESENIALGKHVEQSNLAYGGVPERAIDNNTDGSWISGSVTHTQINRNSWWQADLGKSYKLNSIEIWNRTDCCKSRLSNYYVFVSDEPFESYDPDQTLNQSGIRSIFQSEYPDPSFTADINRTGRYIRIQLMNSGELSLAEVRIFGVPDTELSENLALNATVNQISTIYGSNAEKAIDGNIDGIWINRSVTHTNNELNAWWEADLGGLSNIESVEIFNRTDCCMNRLSDFYLFISEEPFISHDLHLTMNQAGVWNNFQSSYPNSSRLVEVNRSGRYLRIQLANANSLSIAEIRILGNRFPELRNTFMQSGLTKDEAPDDDIIYPIPVENVLHINVSEKISEIEIFNLYGVLMLSERDATQSSHEISVVDLLPGIYLIRLRLADGSHKVFRFIKG